MQSVCVSVFVGSKACKFGYLNNVSLLEWFFALFLGKSDLFPVTHCKHIWNKSEYSLIVERKLKLILV